MGDIYKVTINGGDYWDSVSKKDGNYFERVDKPCHIYVEETKPFITDRMICNYKDASGIKYLWVTSTLGTRLRDFNNYVIVEPSGIMVPKDSFELVEDVESIKRDKGYDISDVTRTSYYCNLVSDTYRGGKDSIPYEEVKTFRDNLFNQPCDLNNPAFLSPFEFAYMFIDTCHKSGINSFNYYDLVEHISGELSSKMEYAPLLWNVECLQGEHYVRSDSLFNAFALLRYIGLVHPQYENGSEYQYGKLVIDENIEKYPQVINGKEEYLPLMQDLVFDHFDVEKAKDQGRYIKRFFARTKNGAKR